MCVGGGEEMGKERGEREGGGREGEREGDLVVYRKVWDFFSPLILFHVMGLVLRRRNGTEKNTLLLLSLLSCVRACVRLCVCVCVCACVCVCCLCELIVPCVRARQNV